MKKHVSAVALLALGAGLALASGASLAEAAWLANHAAARSVARFGPATVSPSELRAATETAQ